MLETIHGNCLDSSYNFFSKHSIQFLYLTFEELILNPKHTITRINNFLDINLSIQDFKNVYRGEFYKTRWTKRDFIKAKLKFWGHKYVLRNVVEKV
jgi:hypothetical protein